ncbi:MAG: hypothetical protein ACJATA_000068 [Sphingobacteriales bacterium]|jgi:hypothetical protein
MEKKLSFLFIEDDEVDFLNIARILKRSKLSTELNHSITSEVAIKKIK